MWRTPEGDRLLTEAEWALFRVGLNLLQDVIQQDVSNKTNDTDTGATVFDRLTPEQKLTLLAETAQALRNPAIPTPQHTAVNEGAIRAVFSMLQGELERELDSARSTDKSSTHIRPLLRAACEGREDREEPLPEVHDTDPDAWEWLLQEVQEGIFWDDDFAMAEAFLDLPPEQVAEKLRAFGLEPDYYLAVPDEPDEAVLTTARQTLARLLDLPIPDDQGLYPAIEDFYHDLLIGPCSPDETAAWADNPWVQIVGMLEPGWDCDYPTWMARFSPSVPTTPLQLVPAAKSEVAPDLPSEIRVEPRGDAWMLHKEDGSYWCGLLENSWTNDPDEELHALRFVTEAEARSAYAQADRMYGERARRHQQAMARLGLADE
ncbi:MAG TPA: hypothetical protein VH575_13110 [Gemmataceae bacterium]